MTNLSSKHESFIALMLKSDEHARRGYELLIARPGFENFFDALAGAGLFDPKHNPAPASTGEAGYFRIPYWDALKYFEAVAKLAGERNDLQLAQKVINVVRSVSRARQPDGTITDNYHTYRVFAEILGLVPTASVTHDDLEFIPNWLGSKFEKGSVGRALDRGALRRFLASESPQDWDKAIPILRHCTAIRWIDESGLTKNYKKPITDVEDYWLKELIAHHAEMLGARVGRKAADIVVERTREVFDRNKRDLPSWLHRPAIEDHEQNHEWLGPENRFVEGLRDVILSWVDHDLSTAKPFVKMLLEDDSAIIRRIGIHVLSQRWSILRSLYLPLCPQLFDEEHLHELYNLLRIHFNEFEEREKSSTIEAIHHLPQPTQGEEPERWLKHIQRNWLSAMLGNGYEPVESWFNELTPDSALGELSDHPDFYSYMESWRGPGPTPYQLQELLAFAKDGSIVERLNVFEQPNSWKGPTTRALVDSLEEAIGLDPQGFLRLLPSFLNAKRPFQYAVIAGFKRLWNRTREEQPSMDWDKAWVDLIQFFEQLIGPREFWTEEVIEDHDLTPNRDWIPPAIADFLRAGTRNDEKAYSPDCLSRTRSLISILLENSLALDEVQETDATNQAINSAKGKAIEALYSHALRESRISDRRCGDHAEVWTTIKPTFESELSKCRNGNYEFSALAGNYIVNLGYLNEEWLRTNIEQIFPPTFITNLLCALDGLAYASATPRIYKILVEKGVIDLALRHAIKNSNAREKIIERMVFAYLWGDEEIDSARFSYLLESGLIEDLDDAAGWFWSVREQQLQPDQVARILKFWDYCVSWSRTADEPPAKLLSSLSRLSCYLQTVTPKELEWLLAVAPYVNVSYYTEFFFEELDRLCNGSPSEVSVVLGKVLETYKPFSDFEDRLKSILTKLADRDKRMEAIALAEKLRDLPGMVKFYAQLISWT